MVKIAFSAVLLAQICILQAYASHYIQFRLYKDMGVLHRVGICLHDGDRALMADQDYFGSSIQNYGFHKDGYAANVKWDNKEVDVQGWGRYKFKNIWSNGTSSKMLQVVIFAFLLVQFCILHAHASHYILFSLKRRGDCSSLKDQSKRDRDRALDY
ncbi:hypothetical protein BGX29_002953 [Mortierella sp. GBA35]|nr:hypothetical protein BGX29_002953 [Mortierella sp. GBA35]